MPLPFPTLGKQNNLPEPPPPPTYVIFFQLVNCYNDNLDKVGFNTNVTIRTVKRLLMFRTEFWTFETKKKKQNKNKSLPLEFQITGMQNLHRKSKDADFHLQFLWRQSLDPSLLCVWSSRTSKLLFKLSEKLTAQSACWEGWFYWLFFYQQLIWQIVPSFVLYLLHILWIAYERK